MNNRSPEALRGIGSKAVAVLVMCAALSGCGVSGLTAPFSSDGGLFGSSKPKQEAAREAGWGANVTEANLLASARNKQNGGDITGSINRGSGGCPAFAVAPGGKSITIRSKKAATPKDLMAVMHRGEITRTARECANGPRGIAVKYGFAGRVLLGPKGRTGNITLPVKVTVVNDLHKTVKTDKVRVSVSVPAGQSVGYFSTVRTITVPLGPGMTPQSYKVQVAFDNSTSKRR
ncbi:MAG: hypothetical protein P8Y67_00975 [Alphaproteobacteria bacterium]